MVALCSNQACTRTSKQRANGLNHQLARHDRAFLLDQQMDFETLSDAVIGWARDRQIIPNSSALAQAVKTHEELGELLSALHRNHGPEVEDAYGDILVTLIVGAKLRGVNLIGCLQGAYNTIKDRKGYLRSDGVFIKDES